MSTHLVFLNRQSRWVSFLLFFIQAVFHHQMYGIKSGLWVYITARLAHLYLFAHRMYAAIAVFFFFFLFEYMTKVLLTFIFMLADKLLLQLKNSHKDFRHNFLVVFSLDVTIVLPSSVNHIFHIFAYGVSKTVCFIISAMISSKQYYHEVHCEVY